MRMTIDRGQTQLHARVKTKVNLLLCYMKMRRQLIETEHFQSSGLCFILPGCLRWRGEGATVSSACRRQRSCLCPRHPGPHSGSGPGRPAPPPCLCGPLGAGFQSPDSLWAPGCASAPGTPGSPSRRHSPPCIYCKKKGRKGSEENKPHVTAGHRWLCLLQLTSCHSQSQNRW